MPYKDPAKEKDYKTKYREYLRKHAEDSITTGKIRDKQKWDQWCNLNKSGATKYPYSGDFTNDVMFDMLILGCFYCGDIATTIDRVNSKLDHTPGNCVGCCRECNISKGVADSGTFVRKAYYRARGKYVDTITDIWFVNKQKPTMYKYKKCIENKGIPFELTKEYFDDLIKGVCGYCHRSPTTWFGVDRIQPGGGYVLDNVVTCCFDCNLDKHINTVDTMMKRNKRIAYRVDTGELIIIDYLKTILHTGAYKSSKSVCAYNKVYESKSEASRFLGKGTTYVCNCIRNGRHSDKIFEITDDFYNFVTENKFENITKKMYMLFDRM